ncbi:zinc finger protein 596-like [Culex pipiens pallens]|uniref:zinc finger protein 596-like n=1 Tax=Culex pipiens pallens TaxID=42434 RepID=UPI001952F352|nr:zinc finger protein 596-like [Culex pipiens pallens]
MDQPAALITQIKAEPPEMVSIPYDPAYTEPQLPDDGDPLLSEIKLEPTVIAQEPPPSESGSKPTLKLVSPEILKTIKPKPGPRRMQMACPDCNKVCTSAGFLRRHKQYCNPRNADGLIPCKLCPAAFKKVIRLRYHMNTHEGNKTFKCRNEGCVEAFYFPETRYNHEEDCRNKEPSTCAVCGATFPFSRSLRSHMKLHEAPRFECQICNKKFFHRKNLREHWLTHFKNKAEAAAAGGQAMASMNEEGESPDEEEPSEEPAPSNQKDPEKIHFCELCGKSFPVEEHLKRHKDFCTGFIPVKIDPQSVEKTVDNPAILDCPVCGKRAESVEALKAHMVQHEKGRHICPVCNRDFASKAILRTHSFVHTDERNHACEICGKGFKTKRAKVKHSNYMHTGSRQHSCEICNDTFTNSHSLRYHMNRHTGNTPYRCQTEGCNEAFPTPDGRQRHQDYCGKELQKVGCTLCKATFKNRKYLRVHMLGHEAKFECGVCGKRFAQNFRLKAHVEKAHQGGEAGSGGEESEGEVSADESEEEAAVKPEPE